MKFGSKEELKHHVQRHEAVKLYACSEFPKRFCTAYSVYELKQHHYQQ